MDAKFPLSHPDGNWLLSKLKPNFCKAGQEPTEGPVLLLGVPNGGIAMTLEDGSDVVECGDIVKATAFEAHL